MKTSFIERTLDGIERAGNRLPHPALLFIWLSLAVIVLSAIASWAGFSATHPVNSENITAVSLLTGEGLRKILAQAVSNFTGFAPVGVVLVAMLGIGVAEHSGLLKACLLKIVSLSSSNFLAYAIAFAGIMSSIGVDVGYVVLLPLAGMIYHAANRPALAGIAVAFAGVSAGFSANLFVGPVDAILAGISTEAAHLVDSEAEVLATDNYFFIVASTFLITLVCGLLGNRLVEPWLARNSQLKAAEDDQQGTQPSAEYQFKQVLVFTLVYASLLLTLSIPEDGALHATGNGSSPLLRSIIPILSIYFAIAGYLFGKANGVYQSFTGAIEGMESAMQTMAYYLVLMFFASQFVNYFNWTNLGLISAIHGANLLGSLQLNSTVLLLFMLLLTASLNLLVGSASAKWTVLAPVFVPMFLLLGIPPENTQMAYRIGDSTTNIITPLMPYFGIALAYVRQYDPGAGMGTVIVMMLPFSLALMLLWAIMLMLWIGFSLPLGP